jgi:hypothetical protein
MVRKVVTVAWKIFDETHCEHACVLARAVVLDPRWRRPTLEIVLACRRLREQAPNRLELIGTREMGRARNRDLRLLEIRACPNERQSLDGLRRTPEVREQIRVARRRDHRPVRDSNRMDTMARLHGLASNRLDLDRPH